MAIFHSQQLLQQSWILDTDYKKVCLHASELCSLGQGKNQLQNIFFLSHQKYLTWLMLSFVLQFSSLQQIKLMDFFNLYQTLKLLVKYKIIIQRSENFCSQKRSKYSRDKGIIKKGYMLPLLPQKDIGKNCMQQYIFSDYPTSTNPYNLL